MLNNDKDFHSGHRARLREKFMQNKLVDYEVLELLLTYAIPRIDIKPLARSLMKKYGNPHAILTASLDDLKANPGVGESTAIFIKAIYEMMILDYKNYLDMTPVFYDYNKIAEYIKLLLSGKTVEEFHVFYLDSNYRLLSDDLHSAGTVDWAAVYPREIMKRALLLGARSIIMVHNHLTPNTSFSTPDIDITTELKRMLETIDIKLYDHLVVSGNVVYSARNLFLIKD